MVSLSKKGRKQHMGAPFGLKAKTPRSCAKLVGSRKSEPLVNTYTFFLFPFFLKFLGFFPAVIFSSFVQILTKRRSFINNNIYYPLFLLCQTQTALRLLIKMLLNPLKKRRLSLRKSP
jgi:hypothetical protein